MQKGSEFRTPLVTHIYTADPSAHVFEGKLYIYPSHDLVNEGLDDGKGDHFQMKDYHVLSLDDVGEPCVDHGQALHIDDVPWASRQMWAPDAAYKNGKYYFYFPAKDKDGIFRIGAAVGDRPQGPFKPEADYINGSFSIDPAVFIDDDGRAYMYFGGLWGGQLEKWQTGSFVIGNEEWVAGEDGPQGSEPSLGVMVAELNDDMLTFKSKPQEAKILCQDGKVIEAGDKDRAYFEGPWMHKFNGKYYLSYSTGPTHYLCYAESDSPTGPFKYKGRILEPVIGWTTHHSIVEFKGKWYLFYHDSKFSGGQTHLRTVMYTQLDIASDGTISTIHPYG
ncbi:MAG: glycoside hydrolase family 43 protein [Oscillospiraceae bacterium]|nr:glycoside hydrolase family 43 protein [Oscillospiraceae bacterium]